MCKDKDRQGYHLNHDGKNDQCQPRLFIEQPRHYTSDQPADAIAPIVETESIISLGIWQYRGNKRLQERVLRRVTDPPKKDSDQRQFKTTEKDKRRKCC